RLPEPRRIEVADAPRADLAAADERLEARDRLLERMASRPVEQVRVEPVRPQTPEARLAGAAHAGRRGVRRQDLRHEEQLVASAGDRLADDLLDGPVAVHLGG